MAALAVIIIFVLIGLIVLVVGAPLRRAAIERVASGEGGPGGASGESEAPLRRAELEAAREAKYREIRDAEMDYRTGKLSEADHLALDAELRAEALEVLNALEALDAEEMDAEEMDAEERDGD